MHIVIIAPTAGISAIADERPERLGEVLRRSIGQYDDVKIFGSPELKSATGKNKVARAAANQCISVGEVSKSFLKKLHALNTHEQILFFRVSSCLLYTSRCV